MMAMKIEAGSLQQVSQGAQVGVSQAAAIQHIFNLRQDCCTLLELPCASVAVGCRFKSTELRPHQQPAHLRRLRHTLTLIKS